MNLLNGMDYLHGNCFRERRVVLDHSQKPDRTTLHITSPKELLRQFSNTSRCSAQVPLKWRNPSLCASLVMAIGMPMALKLVGMSTPKGSNRCMPWPGRLTGRNWRLGALPSHGGSCSNCCVQLLGEHVGRSSLSLAIWTNNNLFPCHFFLVPRRRRIQDLRPITYVLPNLPWKNPFFVPGCGWPMSGVCAVISYFFNPTPYVFSMPLYPTLFLCFLHPCVLISHSPKFPPSGRHLNNFKSTAKNECLETLHH